MKKIFLFSLMVCFVGVGDLFAAFTYDCEVQSIAALSKKRSNEFLFPTNADYKDSNGRALVCGHRSTKGCDNGTVVVVAGNHWWKKKQSDYMKVYRCSTGGGNAWADVGYTALKECSADQRKTWTKIGEINNQKILCSSSLVNTFYRGGYCKNACFTSDCPECDGGAAKTEPVKSETKMCNFDGKKVNLGYCEQNKDCQRATLADTKTGKVCKRCCGENSKGQMENKYLITQCPSGKNGIGFKDAEKTFKPKDIYNGSYRVCEEKKNSCKESRKTEEGKACCDFSAKIAYWDSKTQDCICTDKNASFEKVNGKWQCVPKAGACDSLRDNPEAYACCNDGYKWEDGKCEGCRDGQHWYWSAAQGKGMCIDNGSVSPSTTCTETDCKITINQTIRCFNNGNYFNSTENYSVCKEDLDALRLDCNGLKTRVNACQNTDCIRGLLTRIDAFDELIAKVCKPSGAPTPVFVPDNSAKIAAAKQIVSSFFGSAESNKSVWKDAEGNFNTARLASDLTAGVVLGTVGGVVSGVVIKKKQVEKGFDALHCAVGGQTVADWGDTFNVGLRR